MAQKPNIASRARALAEPIADSLGLRIWDVCYEKEGASYFLRIYIDRDGGVTIDDCEAMHRAIDAPLDEADLISQSYYLEVSSPGLCRELKRQEHFDACVGMPVRIKLIRAQNGNREFCGELCGCDNNVITIENGEKMQFAKSDIAKITLDDDDI